jgi:hypothetical protein
MARLSSTRSVPVAVLAASLATLLLGGCALIQPPPVPRMPRFGLRGGTGDACTADIARAHAAFASAGAAAGDPVATAAAHATAAEAMSAYQVCLAQSNQR